MKTDSVKILHLDNNHPILLEQLQQAGFTNHEDYTSKKRPSKKRFTSITDIVIRSRFNIDKDFIDKA